MRRAWIPAVAAVCAALAAPAAMAQGPAGLPSGRTDYRTLADYEGDMLALAREHPNLVRRFTLPHATSEGRPVNGIEITRDVGRRDGKPVLLLVGMHHGNERPSGEVTTEFGFDLVENPRHDPEIARLLGQVRVILVPVVNVDGFVRNTRRTATNVDMNRNYGFGWGESPPFQGSGPFSEPETQNMRDLISSRQVTTFLTNHTCLANMLYPPLQHKAGLPQDIDRFRAFADAMSRENGYPHLTSADDFETTGEAIDWSYYATRGLGVTLEVCATPPGTPRTFQTLVVDQYLGTGPLAGRGNRGAFVAALQQAADRDEHARITGRVRRGAELRISKEFDLWTNPIPQPDGTLRPSPVPTELTSSMEVTSADGEFSWSVNPSVRPEPPYQADGVHGEGRGFLQEAWTLTCGLPDGTVLQTVHVRVDLGERETVDLERCQTAPR
jgi:Zinc carboxypeptidase